jgi:hypothetical protein
VETCAESMRNALEPPVGHGIVACERHVRRTTRVIAVRSDCVALRYASAREGKYDRPETPAPVRISSVTRQGLREAGAIMTLFRQMEADSPMAAAAIDDRVDVTSGLAAEAIERLAAWREWSQSVVPRDALGSIESGHLLLDRARCIDRVCDVEHVAMPAVQHSASS